MKLSHRGFKVRKSKFRDRVSKVRDIKDKRLKSFRVNKRLRCITNNKRNNLSRKGRRIFIVLKMSLIWLSNR